LSDLRHCHQNHFLSCLIHTVLNGSGSNTKTARRSSRTVSRLFHCTCRRASGQAVAIFRNPSVCNATKRGDHWQSKNVANHTPGGSPVLHRSRNREMPAFDPAVGTHPLQRRLALLWGEAKLLKVCELPRFDSADLKPPLGFHR